VDYDPAFLIATRQSSTFRPSERGEGGEDMSAPALNPSPFSLSLRTLRSCREPKVENARCSLLVASPPC